MKKALLILSLSAFTLSAFAVVSKSVHVITANNLSSMLTATEKITLTNLTVTGVIDARDVKFLRDEMPLLAVLDLRAVTIQSYNGGFGTVPGTKSYPAYEMPQNSFYNSYNGMSKTSLKTLILPSSLTSIGSYSFQGCNNISENLIIPNKVISIGSYAFCNCSSITGNLLIPSSVTTIGAYAFYQCLSLTGISFPNSLATISMGAFYGCSSLYGSLTLPGSVTSIGELAFKNCNFSVINSLNSNPPVIFANTFDGVLVVVANSTALTAYKAAIGWSLLTITAEKHVTVNCPTAGSLALVLLQGGYGPLSSITHLTVTGNLNFIDVSQMKSNMFVLTALDLSGVSLVNNALPDNAFKNKTVLNSIRLPENLQSIGNYAFDGCTSLSGNAPIPNNVTSIGNYAFRSCSSLTGDLIISNNLTLLGQSAFQFCSGLNGRLIIGTSIKVLNKSTFDGCSRLTGSLLIPSNVINIGNSVFKNCSRLIGNLLLPNSVSSIGDSAFYNCSGFDGNLTLSNAITEINSSTFYNCSGLINTVTIPVSVESIRFSCFQNCSNIKVLEVGINTKTIGENAFSGCSSLDKIVVPCLVPPIIFESTFEGVNHETCWLEVPVGMSFTYQNSNYWSLFIFFSESADVSYEIITYIGTGGSLNESNVSLYNGSIVMANANSSLTFTVVPDAGYKVATLIYNGVNVTTQLVNNKYITTPINTNATIHVTFQRIIYTIGIQTGGAGVLNMNYYYGDTPTFDFTPSIGSKIQTVFYNDNNVTANLVGNFYTLPPITSDGVLVVNFIPNLTGYNPTAYSNVKVFTSASDIIVQGVSNGEIIRLYSIDGQLLQVVKAQEDSTTLNVSHGAVYIVKTTTKTFKVVL